MRQKITVTLLLATSVVAACGTTPASTAGHSSPAPTATSGAVLACRLPVGGFLPPAPKGAPDSSIGADGLANETGLGGFLDLPSGSYTPVASSDKSYVAAANAWLPVEPQAISPDQSSYVQARAPRVSLTQPTTALYLVDVRSRATHLLFTAPAGDAAYVLAYTAAGVYVETLPSAGGLTSDLELIDPATGAHKAVPGSQPPINAAGLAWLGVNEGAAWGLMVTSAQQPAFKLMRLSLTDGSVTDWYDTTSSFFPVGFDSGGHPILGIPQSASSTKLLVVKGPKQTAEIQVKGGSFLPGRGQAVADQHGTWVGSSDGSIWLYTPAGTFEKVATVPPQPGADGTPYDPRAARSVAGPCV